VEQLLISHLAGLSLAILATLSTAASSQPLDHMPSPELDPSAVVRIQVEALRNNSQLNEGIVLTYGFASPANKGFTGPLNRFIAMLNSASYKQLLNHRSARYGPVVVSDKEARQIVIITNTEGEVSAYQWVLERHSGGKFNDCWMTAAVIPVKRPAQPEFLPVSTPQQRASSPRG